MAMKGLIGMESSVNAKRLFNLVRSPVPASKTGEKATITTRRLGTLLRYNLDLLHTDFLGAPCGSVSTDGNIR